MEYKPFDLEAAKRGEKVVMIRRFFDPAPIAVNEVCQFPSGTIGAILGNGTPYSFDRNGEAFNYRLVMAPKRKVQRWVNLYGHQQASGVFQLGVMWDTKEGADKGALAGRFADKAFPIEYEVED